MIWPTISFISFTVFIYLKSDVAKPNFMWQRFLLYGLRKRARNIYVVGSRIKPLVTTFTRWEIIFHSFDERHSIESLQRYLNSLHDFIAMSLHQERIFKKNLPLSKQHSWKTVKRRTFFSHCGFHAKFAKPL